MRPALAGGACKAILHDGGAVELSSGISQATFTATQRPDWVLPPRPTLAAARRLTASARRPRQTMLDSPLPAPSRQGTLH